MARASRSGCKSRCGTLSLQPCGGSGVHVAPTRAEPQCTSVATCWYCETMPPVAIPGRLLWCAVIQSSELLQLVYVLNCVFSCVVLTVVAQTQPLHHRTSLSGMFFPRWRCAPLMRPQARLMRRSRVEAAHATDRHGLPCTSSRSDVLVTPQLWHSTYRKEAAARFAYLARP